MRRFFHSSCLPGALLILSFFWVGRAFGLTPTFNISPSVITNNYVGPITLTIGNVTPGQKVTIGEFLDANGNGKIDAGEYQVQLFSVTDGQQSVLGGATNINVPGDTDRAANGRITVVLNYPSINPTLSGIAAGYLFRLSDPNNVFAPVTNSFTILGQTAPQSINGTLYANGVPQSNAVVVIGIQQGGNGGGGAVTDVNGHFSISNAPATYFLLGCVPGYVGVPASVTLTSNSLVTVDITNVPATGVLAGNVSDAGTGQGLPGLFVNAQANNGLTIGFTDTNGNFAMPAIAGQWQIKLNSSSGLGSAAPYGYISLQNNKLTTNLTSGSLSNLNFSFPRATALIYGQLTDNHSNGIPNAFIQADSADFLYEVQATTTAGGQYAVGVFSNSWYVGPQNLPANYLVNSTNVPIVNSQAVLANLQAQRVTAYLYGKLIDDHGNPQANVSLAINSLDTNGNFLTPLNQNFSTAGDGTFAIGLYGGNWNVAPECGSAGASGLVPPSENFTVVDGVSQSNILMIEPIATATITCTIVDSHGNPVNANGYAGATVNGTNYNACSAGNQNSNTFQIAVFPGTWTVGVSGNFSSDGYDNPQNVNVTVGSGGNVNVKFVLYPLGQTPPQLVFPFRMPGSFSFSVNGDPNQNYCVQFSTNLKTWQSLATNTAYGGSFFFTDTNANAPARYYRAVLAP